jgi:hypothetical protein
MVRMAACPRKPLLSAYAAVRARAGESHLPDHLPWLFTRAWRVSGVPTEKSAPELG